MDRSDASNRDPDGDDHQGERNQLQSSFFHESENPFHQHIATIPEGTTMSETALPELIEKPPSPEHSSGQTTGTTSTPSSCDNHAPHEETTDTDAAPEFPRESLQTPSSWKAMPMHRTNRASPSQQEYQQTQQFLLPHDGTTERYGHMQPSPMRYNPANYPSAIKLLVSNNVAASIIGRAGQTISELQAQSRTRIKLSQSGDYFPGTQDRVCLIQGETENVKMALRLLLERLYALQEHQYLQHMAWQIQKHASDTAHSFDFIIRLLVPSTSCGMIIGKAGSNIKFLEETTGVTSVRLSPKDGADAVYPTSISAATNERVVTIMGSQLEQTAQCVSLVLDNMTAHPEVSRYTNMTTSYSRIMSDNFSVAASLTTHGTPTQLNASPPQDPWRLQSMYPYGQTGMQRRFVSAPDLAAIISNHHHQQQLQQQVYQHPHGDPATPDRSGSFSQEIFQTGSFHSQSPSPVASVYVAPQTQGSMMTRSTQRPVRAGDTIPLGMSVVPVHHSQSAPDLLAHQLDQSLHVSDPMLAAASPYSEILSQQQSTSAAARLHDGFVPQAPMPTAPGCFVAQVLVPEQMVGSILGRGGSSLSELQMLSGTRIRVSQRGEYMPGTRSRIVTVRGSSAQSVWQAQFLMSQRMVMPSTAVRGAYVVPAPTTVPSYVGPTATPPLVYPHGDPRAPEASDDPRQRGSASTPPLPPTPNTQSPT